MRTLHIPFIYFLEIPFILTDYYTPIFNEIIVVIVKYWAHLQRVNALMMKPK